ncbi:MAG: hypothetical protein C4346_01530, partial [Chloroflexota bacterium]
MIDQGLASVSDQTARLLATVARLYYLDGLNQQEIAAMFDVSRSTVSRMLTEARERGIVRISIEETDLRATTLETSLIDTFSLRRAIVIRSLSQSPDATRQTVGYFAASIVSDWISETTVIGVAGGRTLAALIRALKPRFPAPRMTAVQLMGNIGPDVSD